MLMARLRTVASKATPTADSAASGFMVIMKSTATCKPPTSNASCVDELTQTSLSTTGTTGSWKVKADTWQQLKKFCSVSMWLVLVGLTQMHALHMLPIVLLQMAYRCSVAASSILLSKGLTSAMHAPLADHFSHQHHPCEHSVCLERKFVVFQTEQELRQHCAREHGGNMSRAEKRQALTIPINVQVSRLAASLRIRTTARCHGLHQESSTLSFKHTAGLPSAVRP